ncbi:COG4223 family protein [Consotaella aegiceratis]|uniref:COG4223 family protein n=1 Tax=Consotaella aegiceratis TaxID=3097961 RepID=UPI002F3FDAE0
MTTRPRRSRPKKTQAPTIDLEAEKTAPAAAEISAAKDDEAVKTPEPSVGDEPVVAKPAPAPAETSAPAETDAPKTWPESEDGVAGDSLAAASPEISPAAEPLSADEAAEVVASPTAPEEEEAVAGPREFAEDEGLKTDSDHGYGAISEEDEALILAAAHPQPARDDDPGFAPVPPAAEPAGSGFGPALAAGLAGAIIALILGGFLQYAGVLPSVGVEEPQFSEGEFARPADVEQVSHEVENLRADLEQVRSAQAAGGDAAAAASGRLGDFEQRIAALEQNAGGGGQDDALAALQQADQQTQTAIDEVRQTAEATRQQVSDLQSSIDAASSAAQQAQTTAQAAQAAADQASQSASKVEQRVAALDASNANARIALSAAALKAAIDRGDPFMSELETYAAAAGSDDSVAQLRDFAAAGVPTEQDLVTQWPDVQEKIAAAIRPSGPDVGIGDQVLSGLKGLVAVRPEGEPAPAAEAGGDVSVLARLDQAMAARDLGAWLRTWETLPHAGQTASADFATAVRSRLAANEVAGSALNTALGSARTAG